MLFWLLGILAIVTANAADPIQHVSFWKDGHEIYQMREDAKEQIFISYACYPYGSKFDDKKCDASKAKKIVSFKGIKNDLLSGGKNPGSVLCKESVKGKVYILKNAKGDENSFCRFADGSFVATATLQKWAN